MEDPTTQVFLQKVQDYKKKYWNKLRQTLGQGDYPKAQLYNGRVEQVEDILQIINDMKKEAE